MAVIFKAPIRVVKTPEEVIEITEIKAVEYRDYPNDRRVEAKIKDPAMGVLTLWEGDMYDYIGDWTGRDAEKRIAELLTGEYKADDLPTDQPQQAPGFFGKVAEAFKGLVN